MARVLPLPALRLFSPAEFNQLLSGGSEGGIDIEDLKGGGPGGGVGGGRELGPREPAVRKEGRARAQHACPARQLWPCRRLTLT